MALAIWGRRTSGLMPRDKEVAEERRWDFFSFFVITKIAPNGYVLGRHYGSAGLCDEMAVRTLYARRRR